MKILTLLSRKYVPLYVVTAVLFVTSFSYFIGTLWNNRDCGGYDGLGIRDVTAFTVGAKIIRDGNIKNLYNLSTQRKYFNELIYPIVTTNLLVYRYLPMYAFLFWPFLFWDRIALFFVYALINIFFIYLIVSLTLKSASYPDEINLLKYPASVISLTIIPLFGPIISTICLVQTSLLLTLGVAVSLYLSVVRRYAPAGFVLAILLLKPFTLLIVPLIAILVFKRGGLTKFLFGFVLSFTVLMAFNYAIYGPNLLIDFIKLVLMSEGVSYGTDLSKNFNLVAPFVYLGVPQNKALYWGIALSVVVFLALAGYIWKRKVTSNLQFVYLFSICGFALHLFSVHTMISDLSMLVIPYVSLPMWFQKRLESGGLTGKSVVISKVIFWSVFCFLNVTIWFGLRPEGVGSTVLYVVTAMIVLSALVAVDMYFGSERMRSTG